MLAATTITNFKTAVNFFIGTFVNPFTLILITLSVLYFLYGVSKYFRPNPSDSDKKEARLVMLWGVVGLFAIVAMWGLVKIVQNTFDFDNSGFNKLPDSTLTPPLTQ